MRRLIVTTLGLAAGATVAMLLSARDQLRQHAPPARADEWTAHGERDHDA